MRLVPDWHLVLKRAWSVRLIAVAALLSGGEAAFDQIGAYLPFAPRTMAALSFGITVAALVARLVAQNNVRSGK